MMILKMQTNFPKSCSPHDKQMSEVGQQNIYANCQDEMKLQNDSSERETEQINELKDKLQLFIFVWQKLEVSCQGGVDQEIQCPSLVQTD